MIWQGRLWKMFLWTTWTTCFPLCNMWLIDFCNISIRDPMASGTSGSPSEAAIRSCTLTCFCGYYIGASLFVQIFMWHKTLIRLRLLRCIWGRRTCCTRKPTAERWWEMVPCSSGCRRCPQLLSRSGACHMLLALT